MKEIRTLLVASLFLLGLSVFAQQTQPGQQPSGDQSQGQPAHRAMPSVDDQLKNMTDRLGLTPEQQAKIKPILEDTHQEAQGIAKDSSLSQDDRRAKLRSVHESSSSKIREVLNDDQKKKFDAWQQEMRGRMHQHQGETPK